VEQTSRFRRLEEEDRPRRLRFGTRAVTRDRGMLIVAWESCRKSKKNIFYLQKTGLFSDKWR
jgi:hypothetical protein